MAVHDEDSGAGGYEHLAMVSNRFGQLEFGDEHGDTYTRQSARSQG